MNQKTIFVCLLILFSVLIAVPDLSGCTTFALADKRGNFILGENFDFPTGLGHIQVNLKGIEKMAFISIPEKTLSWKSRYGSITFNQNGREFPYSGMNEAGLVVVKLMLDETAYPQLDERYGLEELQWIQYQLDVAASVEDVIQSDRRLRVSYKSIAPLHFFAADAKGNAAAIEYLNGKLVCHTGKDLIYKALANNTYQDSLDFISKLDADGRNKLIGSAGMTGSLERFAKAVLLVDAYQLDSGDTIDYAFEILEKVAQMSTHWSIVYDLKNGVIRLKTAKNRDVRELALSAFDFSKAARRLYADIDQDFKGIADFREYSQESNYQLVDAVWNIMEGFLKDLPFKKEWAQYPDELNSNAARKFKLSAARKMVELLKNSNFQAVQAEIQQIKAAQDEYYFGESELIFNAMHLAQMDNKKLPEAIEMLKLTAELFPKSAKAFYWLAKAYTYSANGKFALEILKKALEIEPENRLAKWDMEGFQASQNPLILDKTVLAAYAGEYGERKFSLENSRLVYEKPGQQKIVLAPMAPDIFMCEGIDYLRFRFIREKEKIVAVEGLYNDGQTLRVEKTK